MLIFEKLSENIVMSGGKRYVIPENSKINCIRIKAGILSFGFSELTIDFYYSRKKVRFWKIPLNSRRILFLNFKKDKSGYHYRKPIFFNY